MNTGSNNSNEEKQYQAVAGFSFEEYYNEYNDDVCEIVAKNYTQAMKDNYFENPDCKMGKNSYLEIGSGVGVTLSQFAPYFNSVSMIEPNLIFANKSKERIKDSVINNQNKKFTEINKLISDFDASKDLINESSFDFINMQHVMWHIPLNDWDNVLNNLYGLLNDNGMLVVSYLPKYGFTHDIHKYFIPVKYISIYINV